MWRNKPRPFRDGSEREPEGGQKTAFLLVAAWERSGGLEGVAIDLAESLVELGWQVKVIDCFGAGSVAAVPGVVARRMSPASRIARSLWYRGLWRGPVARLLGREAKPGDVIIFGHVNLLSAQKLIPPTPGVARVAWLYGLEIWGPQATRWAEAINRLDAVVSISQYTADRAREGGVRVPVTVIPCCVDTEQFKPAGNTALIRRREVLICGRMAAAERYKGHDLLVRILPRVSKLLGEPVQLRIVGAGDDAERIRAVAADVAGNGGVTLTGRVDHEELIEAYQRCGVFCMPSIVTRRSRGFWTGEGFGIVYIEAAACGRPVIASADGGSPETINAGVTGLLADPRCPDMVCQAIAAVLADPKKADAMGASGREFAVAKFSKQAFRRHLRDFFSTTMSRAT